MHRLQTLLPLALAFLFCAASVRAQEQPRDPKILFAEVDTNGDGIVDLQEFHQRVVDVFYLVDSDKDGFLSPAELKQLPHPEQIKDVDKDGDGKVSLHEFVRIRFLQFEAADTSHDGELSLEEVIVVYRVEGK